MEKEVLLYALLKEKVQGNMNQSSKILAALRFELSRRAIQNMNLVVNDLQEALHKHLE